MDEVKKDEFRVSDVDLNKPSETTISPKTETIDKNVGDTSKDNLLMPSLRQPTSGATATSAAQPTGNVTQNTVDTKVDEKTGRDENSGKNPPVLAKGRVKDTNMVNQDGQPLENSTLVTGDTGKGAPSSGFGVHPDGTVDERIPVNTADGTTGGATDVNKDQHERMEERDRVVIDRVSGNPVVVRGRIKEDDRKVFEEMSNQAHDSLKGSTITEIGLGHPYWGLMERARQFGKSKGLI